MPQLLFQEFKNLPQIEAIALGGSRAGNNYDEKSDYDVYVYYTELIPEEIRNNILSKYCCNIEIENHFWEYEDNCKLKNGIDIDIIYRKLDDFASAIENVVEKYHVSNGYTTCMWHNLLNSKILFDKTKRLTKTQQKYMVKYPSALKQNIINHNMKLLRNAMPAYEIQIAKAVKRNDLISINHRVTEFMASYFDIIFALNELTHPGEKRLIDLCLKNCKLLPKDFKSNIEILFSDMFMNMENINKDIDTIITELNNIL